MEKNLDCAGRSGQVTPRASPLRALALVVAAVFFTLLGCGTILLLSGQLYAWQIAAAGVTGAGAAIGIFIALGSPSP